MAVRELLSWCAALTIGFGGALLVASVAFNALDSIGVYETSSDCREILCDVNWLTVALTAAGGLALGVWLTARARRWIGSRFTEPAP